MKNSSAKVCIPLIVLTSLSAVAFSAAAYANGKDDDEEGAHGANLKSQLTMYLSEVKRGYEIVPSGVHLNLRGKDRGLVGLGSYLVNTGGCIDCHTHPNYMPMGDPYLGLPELVNFPQYMTGGRKFGPKVVSANITPDSTGKPAGLTLAQFIVTLRTGHNPNDPPGQILQVMPWPVIGKKTNLDLTAIYEYLRAIPSLPNNPDPGP